MTDTLHSRHAAAHDRSTKNRSQMSLIHIAAHRMVNASRETLSQDTVQPNQKVARI
jgi:hypothetical protein